MSNILIILICVVIIAYKMMTQKPKAKHPARPKPVIGFPETSVEIEEDETSVPEEQPQLHKGPIRYTQQLQKQRPKPAAPAATISQPEKKTINLRPRDEARKAFIYSEIFKRKY